MIDFDEIYEQILDIDYQYGKIKRIGKKNKFKWFKLLESYFEISYQIWRFYEFECSSFSPNYRFEFDFDKLYKYAIALENGIEEVVESSKAKAKPVFALICILFYELNFIKQKDENMYFNYELFIEKYPKVIEYFPTLFDRVCPDWYVCIPRSLNAVGKFYLYSSMKDEKLAKKYFTECSKIDYDGRQTLYPFIQVGLAQAQLAKMYQEGIGCRRNYKKALQLYEDAAYNLNVEYLPISGLFFLNGWGVAVDYIEAAYRFDLDEPNYPQSIENDLIISSHSLNPEDYFLDKESLKQNLLNKTNKSAGIYYVLAHLDLDNKDTYYSKALELLKDAEIVDEKLYNSILEEM